MAEPSVMLVDDHPLFRRGLASMIAERTALRVVAEADDGRSALTLARIYRPDVAVVDLALPDMGGLELVARLRRVVPDTRCVVMTLYNDGALVERAIALGVSGYLTKTDSADVVGAGLNGALAGELYVSPGVGVAPAARPDASIDAPDWPALLTRRERAVLRALSSNSTSREIAGELGVSVRTVQNHRARIVAKLGLSGVHGLLRFAIANADRIERDP